MAVLLAYLNVPLTWPEIFKRTGREAMSDNIMGMSAQLAYYFFFSLFPALLLLIAIASYFPLQTLVDEVFKAMSGFAPPDALRIITDQIQKIREAKPAGLLTFGVATAVWSSSSAMTANHHHVEQRVRHRRRASVVESTADSNPADGPALRCSSDLVWTGDCRSDARGKVADWVHMGAAFEWSWKILQWPVVFALACTGIAMIYYFAPDADQDWVWLTPGSVLSTTLWLLASLAFKYYVVNISSYAATYGALGGVMVLMLWFYISGAAILLGAEMNAEIEHASPYGKEPGEKVPGQRRVIGSAAMRAWLDKPRGRGGKPPSADDVKKVTEQHPAAAAAMQAHEAPGRAQQPVAPKRVEPAAAMAASPGVRPQAKHTGGGFDWLLGITVAIAQFWMTTEGLAKDARLINRTAPHFFQQRRV
jgi:membrane protein